MSTQNVPILHANLLNSLINVSDMETNNSTNTLTIATADARYLKLSGGTELGAVNFNGNTTYSSSTTETHNGNATFSNAITVPYVNLSTTSNSQTSSQIGYQKSFVSALSGGSVVSGSLISYNNLTSVNAGVWIINYYFSAVSTASVTYTAIIHGLNTSNSSFNYASSTSSYVSETVPTSTYKYMSGTYVVRPSASSTYYALINMSFTTSGTMTVQLGINATRIA
jgi:hypothetical protein